jgi:hypothetical protein
MRNISHGLYSLPDTEGDQIKGSGMNWVCDMYMEINKGSYLKERDHLEDLHIDGRIILK